MDVQTADNIGFGRVRSGTVTLGHSDDLIRFQFSGLCNC